MLCVPTSETHRKDRVATSDRMPELNYRRAVITLVECQNRYRAACGS
jgi:hypothetical protein